MESLSEAQTKFLYLLAYLYMQQCKYDMALRLFRVLRLHNPKDNKIALTLTTCLHKAQHLDEALKVLDSIPEKDLTADQNIVFFYIKSKILWDLKQVDASREMLHKYLKLRQSKQ
jgi:tetratricopeptide (TPR) repeat protein